MKSKAKILNFLKSRIEEAWGNVKKFSEGENVLTPDQNWELYIHWSTKLLALKQLLYELEGKGNPPVRIFCTSFNYDKCLLEDGRIVDASHQSFCSDEMFGPLHDEECDCLDFHPKE